MEHRGCDEQRQRRKKQGQSRETLQAHGETSGLLGPGSFDAEKDICVPESPTEMRVRKDGAALKGDCRLVILKQRRP
jgi:hypothetical protein